MPEKAATPSAFLPRSGVRSIASSASRRKMGIERNLTAGEIVGQILLVAARHGLSPDRQPS